MEGTFWGRFPAGEAYSYTLTGRDGAFAVVTNFGAEVLSVTVPDRDGKPADVALGLENPLDYMTNPAAFGALIGPYANRIGGAAFRIDGRTYTIEANENGNTLHSGSNPFHHRLWETLQYDGTSVSFRIRKPDMDSGFPGNLELTVTYSFSDDNRLTIHYAAVSDQDTAFNPTNHTYWNLAGHNSGTVLDQLVTIDADYFTPADAQSIPHGDITAVDGTPMDFRQPKRIGQDITRTDYLPIRLANGYDHNYVLGTYPGKIRHAGSMEDPASGRRMDIYTDMPGLQFYTGNFLDPVRDPVGKGGIHYAPHAGAAFETQFFPNAINVPFFPQPLVHAGIRFESTTAYAFSVVK